MDLHGGHHWIMGEHFRLFTKKAVTPILQMMAADSMLLKKSIMNHVTTTPLATR